MKKIFLFLFVILAPLGAVVAQNTYKVFDVYADSEMIHTYKLSDIASRDVRTKGETSDISVVLDDESYEYVDLGLPSGTLWATCNVGAASPADYGVYFAWGETTPKTNYDWSTYKWCNGSYDTQTKYCTDAEYGTVDNRTVLEPSDDAATVNCCCCWRMPTTEEQKELANTDYCTWTWTTKINSAGETINGYEVTSKSNGNFIFLPAAGYRFGTSLGRAGSYGYYWSSSLYLSGQSYAFGLYFFSDGHYWYEYFRCFGLSVRPVRASARN